MTHTVNDIFGIGIPLLHPKNIVGYDDDVTGPSASYLSY